jgi:hypothetical protein
VSPKHSAPLSGFRFARPDQTGRADHDPRTVDVRSPSKGEVSSRIRTSAVLVAESKVQVFTRSPASNVTCVGYGYELQDPNAAAAEIETCLSRKEKPAMNKLKIDFRRMGMIMLAGLMPVVLTMVGSTSMASAATPTCSGASCTGKDPAITHCADDSYVVSGVSAPIRWGSVQPGIIQILWSPRCQTNWGRIVLNSYDPNPEHLQRIVEVQNSQGGDVSFLWSGPGQYIYGDMLYSPTCAWAIGNVDISYANAVGRTGNAC